MSLILRVVPVFFVLLWSTGFIGTKLGAPYAEPLSFLVLRYGAVLVLITASLVVMRPTRTLDTAQRLHSMVVGILVHGIYLGAVFWSIHNGMPAGVAALIVGVQPLATALLAGLVLGERLTAWHWTGMAMGLFGLTLVIGPKLGLSGTGIDAATVSVVAAGVLAITSGTIYQKRFVRSADLRAGLFYQYLGALFVTGIAALAMEDFIIVWSPTFIFALGWLVLVLSFGAVFLLMVMIRNGAVSRVASLFYLVPAATALESYLLFGEHLGLIQLVGMAIIVAAVALAGRPAPQTAEAA